MAEIELNVHRSMFKMENG